MSAVARRCPDEQAWLTALRLTRAAALHELWGAGESGGHGDHMSWIEKFDVSTSPERLEAVFKNFSTLFEAESQDVFGTVRAGARLLDELSDMAKECKTPKAGPVAPIGTAPTRSVARRVGDARRPVCSRGVTLCGGSEVLSESRGQSRRRVARGRGRLSIARSIALLIALSRARSGARSGAGRRGWTC